MMTGTGSSFGKDEDKAETARIERLKREQETFDTKNPPQGGSGVPKAKEPEERVGKKRPVDELDQVVAWASANTFTVGLCGGVLNLDELVVEIDRLKALRGK